MVRRAGSGGMCRQASNPVPLVAAARVRRAVWLRSRPPVALAWAAPWREHGSRLAPHEERTPPGGSHVTASGTLDRRDRRREYGTRGVHCVADLDSAAF